MQKKFKEPLSKKYRPQNFSDIIYHDEIKTILINSIIEKNIANGILLYGEKGTGKTTIARIFAKSINCENPKNGYEPCNICDSCVEITNSRHPDVAEIDAASKNSVDSIRELIEEAKYLPIKSEYKIYILDEVHMLSNSAFNALLKILEEPPYYVKFCLSTTEYHKIPATITSRCQRLNLKKINNDVLKKQLKIISDKENIKIDEKSLNIISSIAKGSARDAISILDQASILTNQGISAEKLSSIIGYQDDENELIGLINEICESNIEKSLNIIENMYQKNISIDLFFNKILDLLTELMVYQKIQLLNEKQNLYISNVDIKKIKNIVEKNDFEKLNKIWNTFSESQNILKDNIYDNQFYLLNLTILRSIVNDGEIKNTDNFFLKKNSNLKEKFSDTKVIQSNLEKEDSLTKILDIENSSLKIEVTQNDEDIKNNKVQSDNLKEKKQNMKSNSKEILNENDLNNDKIIKNQKSVLTEEIEINLTKKQKEIEQDSNSIQEKKLLKNHEHLLFILNKLKENELHDVAKNNKKIFNYQEFEIYDNHTIPTKFLQIFCKILRQYSKEKWRIIYIDINEKNKIDSIQDNEAIEKIELKIESKNNNHNTEQKNSFLDIKNQFLETEFFKNAKEKFDIESENVKITK